MKEKYVALKPFNNSMYYKNGIFTAEIDFLPSFLVEAKKFLLGKKIFLNTIDVKTESPPSVYVYLDVPYFFEIKLWFKILRNRKKSILFLWEPSLVNPFNFMKIFHAPFARVYTWNDQLVDNKKYFLSYLPKMSFGIQTKQVPFKKKKLIILMNSNWLPFKPFEILAHTKELYTKRIEAIEFFEKNHPDDFELWGRGWNKAHKYSFSQRFFGFPRYHTYKNSFPHHKKIKIISQFKFSLCFENCQENGYLSEKISECFKAKCVPIYWGAPNIESLMPKGTYIDFRNFKNYQELFIFLTSMKESEYNTYITNIEKTMEDKNFLEHWYETGFAKFFLRVIKDYL